jgi:hypothetical protein
MVTHLCVALCGLKQGALKWYKCLCSELRTLGFHQTEADWGIFITHIGCEILLLTSYIDDCTVTGSSKELVHNFKAEMGTRFKITDLGPIRWLLGMKVTWDQDRRTLSISQEPYIEAILAKYNFIDANPSPSQWTQMPNCP